MPTNSTESMQDEMDRIVIRYGSTRRLLQRPKSYEDAIKTAREHFSCHGTPTFHARLKVPGQQAFSTDQQNLTKTNWAVVAPQISILLLQQGPPSQVKNETASIPVAKPNKVYKTPSVSAKHKLVGLKAEYIKVFVTIKYGTTLKKHFTIGLSKPLETIFKAFANLVGEDRDVLRFYFAGNRLDEHATVNSCYSRLPPGGTASITAAKVLKIAIRDGEVMKYFSLTSNTSLRVLEKAWAKEQGVGIGDFWLAYKGKMLTLDCKAHDYGIDSGDIIDAI
ncbi:hypothetical protein FS837_000009 [Tulasnella sp. UAMH 9824]|nr:hypothetical protein FS837_000009 [Tulasnella sp. UAMH 9824]